MYHESQVRLTLDSMNFPYLPFAATFVAVVVMTPMVRMAVRALGLDAQPRADRWHKVPTPRFGGVAIFVAVNLGVWLGGLAGRAWPILAASALMFGIGLVDDFLRLGPPQKLALQLAPALVIVKAGYLLPWTPSAALNVAFTLLWLVGITNAINLLDNMDGLATGIAAIAAVSLATTFIRNGQLSEAALITIFLAALAGFLIYNFNPASIFMGDCGSHFIGFFLASTALLAANVGGRSKTLLPVIFVPVTILLIPIFDTAFVAFVRKISGRPSMVGGRDHTSHRLVALGLKERTAVLLLYALALVAGGIAIAARDLPFDLSLALIGAMTILVAILGFYLAGVKVYPADGADAAGKRLLPAILIDLSYKRRVFEVLLDVFLITYAYYLAYRLHFGPPDGGPDWSRFVSTFPLILAIKVVVFLASGTYSGMWKYLSIDDALVYVKAVAGSSIVVVLVLLGLTRFHGLSRVVFLLDGLILLVLVIGTRSSFRFLESATRRMRSSEQEGVRALLYGAGDGGELLLRELRNNRFLGRTPVAFFDDDPRKAGKVMHSLPVLGGDLANACASHDVAEVIVTTQALSAEHLARLTRICGERGIQVSRLRIEISSLDSQADPAGMAGERGRGGESGVAASE